MAEPSLASPQNLLHVQWKNPEYLSYLSSIQQQQQQQQQQSQTNKQTSDPNSSPLNESNVLSYFSTSPFFDRRSNNEQIRMQNIANSQQPGLNQSSAQFEEEELKRFTGLEFALVHHKPPGCFVIHKRWRYGPDHAVPIAAYYVVNDSIYQAPDLYNVLASRLQSTLLGLRTSFAKERKARASFNPRRGHHGRFIVPDEEVVSEDEKDEEADKGEEGEREAEDDNQEEEDDDESMYIGDLDGYDSSQIGQDFAKRGGRDDNGIDSDVVGGNGNLDSGATGESLSKRRRIEAI